MRRPRRSSSAGPIAARLPDDLPTELALAVMDVCGAPALTARVVARYVGQGRADRSSRSSGAPARADRWRWRRPARAGPARTVGVVPVERERDALGGAGARRRRRPRRRPRPGRARRRRRRRRAAPRTSPSSASTSPAASTAPSWRRRTLGTVDLLLDGHVVRGGRAGRRGPGRGRHAAHRQRVRRPGTPTSRSTCCASPPASGRCSRTAWASETGLSRDSAGTRAGRRETATS